MLRYNFQSKVDAMRARQLAAAVRSGETPRTPKNLVKSGQEGPMRPDDPLAEMLPGAEFIDELKWFPRWMPSTGRSGRTLAPLINRPEPVLGTVPSDPSEILKAFLMDTRKSQCDRQGRTRYQQLLQEMFKMATSDKMSPQKISSITAFLDRLMGKVAPSPAELESEARKGGFQIVHIHPVAGNIPVETESKPALAPAPEFIEGEFSTQ